MLAKSVCDCYESTQMKSIRMTRQKLRNSKIKNEQPRLMIEMRRTHVSLMFNQPLQFEPSHVFKSSMIIIFLDGITQAAGFSAKQKPLMKHMMSSSLDVTTSTSQKKLPGENLQLAECVGDVRALLIDILCDEIALSVESEGYESTMEILDECHTTFLSCFNAFYPTNTLKWNCLCDLLMRKDKVIIEIFATT